MPKNRRGRVFKKIRCKVYIVRQVNNGIACIVAESEEASSVQCHCGDMGHRVSFHDSHGLSVDGHHQRNVSTLERFQQPGSTESKHFTPFVIHVCNSNDRGRFLLLQNWPLSETQGALLNEFTTRTGRCYL